MEEDGTVVRCKRGAVLSQFCGFTKTYPTPEHSKMLEKALYDTEAARVIRGHIPIFKRSRIIVRLKKLKKAAQIVKDAKTEYEKVITYKLKRAGKRLSAEETKLLALAEKDVKAAENVIKDLDGQIKQYSPKEEEVKYQFDKLSKDEVQAMSKDEFAESVIYEYTDYSGNVNEYLRQIRDYKNFGTEKILDSAEHIYQDGVAKDAIER